MESEAQLPTMRIFPSGHYPDEGYTCNTGPLQNNLSSAPGYLEAATCLGIQVRAAEK